MAAAATVVDRVVPASTGVVAYHDRGYRPRALVDVHAQGNNLDTFGSAQMHIALGVDDPASAAVGPARSVCYTNNDGDPQPEGHSGIFDTLVHGGSSSALDRDGVQSMGLTGEVMDWSGVTNPGKNFPSLAIGGIGVQAAAGDFVLPTSGSVTVSGLAFAPTFVMLIWEVRATLGGTPSGGRIGYGFSNGTNHRSVSCRSPLALVSDERTMFRDDSASSQCTATGLVEWRSPITFTADGFTLTPDVYPAATKIHGYLALAGVGTVTVGTDSKRTTTGAQSTATGNVPTLILLIGCGATVADANTGHTNFMLGIITENENAAVWCGAQTGSGNANTSSYATLTKAWVQGNYDGNTIVNDADGALTATGFDLDWTTTDGVAQLFGWAALEVPGAILPGEGSGNHWWWRRGW